MNLPLKDADLCTSVWIFFFLHFSSGCLMMMKQLLIKYLGVFFLLIILNGILMSIICSGSWLCIRISSV